MPSGEQYSSEKSIGILSNILPILHPQIKPAMDDSLIDCNWYYGCLFSPKKNVCIDAISSFDVGDGDRKGVSCIAKDETRNDQGLIEEGRRSSSLCNKDGVGEVEWLAGIFRVLDEDRDGRVSADEIMSFLLRLRLDMPKEQVELAVRSISTCGDEFLTAMEFAEFYKIIFADKDEEADTEVMEEKTVCEAFGLFDQNGDGFISAKELGDVLCRLGFLEGRDVNCCQTMIKSVDCNGDGFVDIHEFKNLVTISTCPFPDPHIQYVTAIN